MLRLNSKEKRSYPELEGKDIVWSNSCLNDGREYEAVVIGCDYHIGITIVDKYDKDDYLTCVNGPLSPRYKDKPMSRRELQAYNKKFKLVLLMISEGFYDTDIKRISLKEDYPDSRTYMNTCSFL
jgi:hypothetical protein